jgi:hypothetical protein
MRKSLYLLCLSLLVSVGLSAQSFPSAEGRRVSVWAGAEISAFNPDYGCQSSSPFSCGKGEILGISPFVDANHLLFERIGVEGQARFLHWRGPVPHVTEASYLAGPRVGLLHFRNTLYVSGKFLVGKANIGLRSGEPGNGSHFAMAPAGMAEFKLTRRVAARAEYEYQIWPFFKGVPTGSTSGQGGLTPNGFSFGVSYALLR